MSQGSSVVVSSNPKGQFLEGIIGDTSKPGSLMQVKAATAKVGGRFTYIQSAPGTDGVPTLIAVLLEDDEQGKLITDAYVSGTRCRLYCPIAGEELNVIVGEGAGTSNTFAIGDLFMVDGDGQNLIPSSGSPVSKPFQSLEADTQIASHGLVLCVYTGH